MTDQSNKKFFFDSERLCKFDKKRFQAILFQFNHLMMGCRETKDEKRKFRRAKSVPNDQRFAFKRTFHSVHFIINNYSRDIPYDRLTQLPRDEQYKIASQVRSFLPVIPVLVHCFKFSLFKRLTAAGLSHIIQCVRVRDRIRSTSDSQESIFFHKDAEGKILKRIIQ